MNSWIQCSWLTTEPRALVLMTSTTWYMFMILGIAAALHHLADGIRCLARIQQRPPCLPWHSLPWSSGWAFNLNLLKLKAEACILASLAHENILGSLTCSLITDTESNQDLQQSYQAYNFVTELEIRTVWVLSRPYNQGTYCWPYNQGTYSRCAGMAWRPLTVWLVPCSNN